MVDDKFGKTVFPVKEWNPAKPINVAIVTPGEAELIFQLHALSGVLFDHISLVHKALAHIMLYFYPIFPYQPSITPWVVWPLIQAPEC